MTIEYLIVPGYGDSGPTHWQTLWQERYGWNKIHQDDWNNPDPNSWAKRIHDQAMTRQTDVIIVAHSLGCHAFALAFSDGIQQNRIIGALLVAPPDPNGSGFPKSIKGNWSTRGVLPCKSIVVYSSNDPYASSDYSQDVSKIWGSHSICIGDAGHINAASKLGYWDYGLSILEGLS